MAVGLVVFVSFRTNEEGYPFETSTDDKCFFSFTVLGKDYVDGFLQHLNSQQPTIRFTMEIEKITLSPFSTRQFQGIQTVFSLPLFTVTSSPDED